MNVILKENTVLCQSSSAAFQLLIDLMKNRTAKDAPDAKFFLPLVARMLLAQYRTER
jgi:hypothetical protein